MTVIEYTPPAEAILDFVNDGLRQLQEAGIEPKYILMGPEAYERMREAMAARFRREAGYFETYQYFPIVVDPDRGAYVCVLPGPESSSRDVGLTRPGS